MSKGVDSQHGTKDFLDKHDNHEVRIKHLELGAHPVRYDWGPGFTTPWFLLELGAGWEGNCYWRIARSIVQMRGTLEGPTHWESNTLAFYLPPDIVPAWSLNLVVMHTDGTPTRLRLATNGYAYAYRRSEDDPDLELDAVRFPRG